MSYEFDIASGKYVDSDSSLINTHKPKKNQLSVSDALLIAKSGLEQIKLNIIGEISEISNKPGYKAVYFTIKDEKSALPCLMWKNKYLACDVDLKPGDLVEVKGKFSLYAAKGRMNFDVSYISLAGEGELRMRVAQLAKKLQAQGLTDPGRKKSIPKMPERIGVVTSPRGAVIHDILRTLNRRMPIARVVFAGTAVEGNNAPKNMIEAINVVEKANVDVILLCRGGGSFEDLMPFNDESLALKIVDCTVPIVTGIGHEPDTTIADLVSDLRASTPTAAAETVSFNAPDFIADYSTKLDGIKTSTINRLKATKEKLDAISSRPVFADARHLYAAEFQNIDYLQEKLNSMLSVLTNDKSTNLEHLFGRFNNTLQSAFVNYQAEFKLAAAKLHDKSPLVVISRGYSISRDKDNKLIKSIDQVEQGDNLNVQVSDGKIDCRVVSKNKFINDSQTNVD